MAIGYRAGMRVRILDAMTASGCRSVAGDLYLTASSSRGDVWTTDRSDRQPRFIPFNSLLTLRLLQTDVPNRIMPRTSPHPLAGCRAVSSGVREYLAGHPLCDRLKIRGRRIELGENRRCRQCRCDEALPRMSTSNYPRRCITVLAATSDARRYWWYLPIWCHPVCHDASGAGRITGAGFLDNIAAAYRQCCLSFHSYLVAPTASWIMPPLPMTEDTSVRTCTGR